MEEQNAEIARHSCSLVPGPSLVVADLRMGGPGHGRLMKEWLAVAEAASDDDWLSLATASEWFVEKRGDAGNG